MSRGYARLQPHSGSRDDRRKGAVYSERDGVIVPRKRQWPDAGIALVTRGGLLYNMNTRHSVRFLGFLPNMAIYASMR